MPFGIFLSSGRGSFHVLSAPWHAVSPPGPARKFVRWPRSVARALGVQSGKSARGGIPITSSRPGPWKPTCIIHYQQVKEMSDVSCDIWDLECHQCRQTLHTWWWIFFSQTPTCQTCDHLHYTQLIWVPFFAKLTNYKPTHNQPFCVPHLRN